MRNCHHRKHPTNLHFNLFKHFHISNKNHQRIHTSRAKISFKSKSKYRDQEKSYNKSKKYNKMINDFHPTYFTVYIYLIDIVNQIIRYVFQN
jgi:hypothetical protein